MNTYDTIYKRTSTGKVQIWYAEVEGDKFRTVSGQQDGKKTVSAWTVAKPKNVGKANATTGETQAIAEVEAMYEKKLAREYRRSLDDIDQKHYTKPMKSAKWKDVKDRPKPGTRLGVEPKYDGMRCLTSINGPKSQDGKIVPGAPHIFNALQPIFAIYPDLELDGELYNHEFAEEFENLMSALKKEPETEEQREYSARVVQYYLYDIASHPGTDEERRAELVRIYNTYLNRNPMFVLAEREEVVMNEDGSVIDPIVERHLENKYEGAMVRVLSARYHNKHTKTMLKVKPMMDDEFLVLRIEEGKGNWAGHAKRVWVRLHDGQECKATPKGTKAAMKKLYEDRHLYEGKSQATVTFLRYTADGMLYLPIVKTISRWDV